MRDHYVEQLDKWKERYKKEGRAIVSAHNAYPVREGRFVDVMYFGKTYVLDLEDGNIRNQNGEASGLSMMGQMMIYSHLLCLKADAHPAFEKVPLSGIRGASVFEKAFLNPDSKAAIRYLEEHQERLEELPGELGGVRESAGDFSITLHVLDKVDITYIFWFADEEFPTNVNVLFDKNITEYMHPESVIILAGEGFKKLQEGMEHLYE